MLQRVNECEHTVPVDKRGHDVQKPWRVGNGPGTPQLAYDAPCLTLPARQPSTVTLALISQGMPLLALRRIGHPTTQVVLGLRAVP